MPFLEKQLTRKRSQIPGSGKGLFTRKPIPKGTRIVEYKGRIMTWKKASAPKEFNGYLFYIKKDQVIDASRNLKDFGRYANDARGLARITGLTNNSEYVEENGRVYIDSIKAIPAGKEILVGYGKEYWQIVRKNLKAKKKVKK